MLYDSSNPVRTGKESISRWLGTSRSHGVRCFRVFKPMANLLGLSFVEAAEMFE